MVWAYLTFMQFLIQWSGNLPVEVEHYLHRTQGGWQWVALGFFLLQFCGPFILILFRKVKEKHGGLEIIAGLMLAGVTLNIFWVVKPMFSPDTLRVAWLDLGVSLVMAAVWVAVYGRNLLKQAKGNTYA